jgi:hypothetical protein
MLTAAFLFTFVASEVCAQANTSPSVQLDSSVPDPNSDEKAAQIQNTPFVIDDNGEKLYFLVNPSPKKQPMQRSEERPIDVTDKVIDKVKPN